MGTYTDARLLDTAEAIEGLPMFRKLAPATPETDTPGAAIDTDKTGETGTETAPRKLAPMLAPDAVQTGHLESISDHNETSDTDGQNTKKPRKTLDFTGFSGVGDTELESVTSTMS